MPTQAVDITLLPVICYCHATICNKLKRYVLAMYVILCVCCNYRPNAYL